MAGVSNMHVLGPAETVVLVAFDSTTDDTTELSEVSTPEGTEPVRSRVFKLAFSRAIRTSEHDRQLAKPAGYLGVVSVPWTPSLKLRNDIKLTQEL